VTVTVGKRATAFPAGAVANVVFLLLERLNVPLALAGGSDRDSLAARASGLPVALAAEALRLAPTRSRAFSASASGSGPHWHSVGERATAFPAGAVDNVVFLLLD
jgi:hypothetical protein